MSKIVLNELQGAATDIGGSLPETPTEVTVDPTTRGYNFTDTSKDHLDEIKH